MFQPYTTDNTERGHLIARNAMRQRLWADAVLAHQFLCHPGQECQDGCDGCMLADDYQDRLELYQSELEVYLEPTQVSASRG